MGESLLAGSEFKASSQNELILREGLEKLKCQRWHVSLKNDDITVLVEAELTIIQIIRRENRIETGHLTLDDVYYEGVNDAGFRIFFPLVQFQRIEEYCNSRNFHFDTFWWMFRAL